MRKLSHAELHHVTVTHLDRDAPDGIAIDPALLEAACIAPLEEVRVISRRNGQQWSTHTVPASSAGSVVVQGGAASLFDVGHELDIIAFAHCDEAALRAGVTQRFVVAGSKNVVQRVNRRITSFDGTRFTHRVVAEKVDSAHPLVL